MRMQDCIFCKIVKNEIPSLRIYEDESTVAMLDVKPLAPGHTVVIPKEHLALFEDLSDDISHKIFSTAREALKMIKRSALNPDAFTIGINDGKAAGQFVPHLHVHIIPRYEKDGGGSVHTIVQNPPQEDLKSIHDKITKNTLPNIPEKPEKKIEEMKAKGESLEERIKRLEMELGL